MQNKLDVPDKLETRLSFLMIVDCYNTFSRRPHQFKVTILNLQIFRAKNWSKQV